MRNRRYNSYVNGSTTAEKKMTEQNLKNNENLATNEQSKKSNTDKALFISEWRVKDKRTLQFPIQGREGEIVIDWGDGSSDTMNSGDDRYMTHEYLDDGTYTIKVDGIITQWSLRDRKLSISNRYKLIKILSYGETSFGPYAFENARNLVGLPEGESPRFSANSAKGFFKGASSFNQPIEHWDMSNVTDMSEMFTYAKRFNQSLDKWDVSNVTNMNRMFNNAKSFNQPLDKWDVSNVTDMSWMFSEAKSFNQPLDKWDVSNVTNMRAMFSDADRFNQPLDKWDTSNVTDMGAMFSYADRFDQPLDKWDTSNVTDMCRMFFCADRFNQPLNDWDVSNVTNMNEMFSYADRFNQPLDKWDISNICDMDYIFNESGLDEDNYSILLHSPYSERWAKVLN